MPYDLRPLTLAELLDRAFGLYRRHFWLFVGIMAVPSLAMLVLSVAQPILGGPPSPDSEPPASELSAARLVTIAIVGMVMLLVFLFYWISYAVALGATTFAVSEIYADRTPTITDSFRATTGKVGRLAWLLLMIGVRIFVVLLVVLFTAGIGSAIASMASPILAGVGVFLAILVGFGLAAWMFLRYAVAVPSAVLEDNSASDAIARSIELTKGSLHRVFLLLVFTVIVTYAALMIFQVPFIAAAIFVGPETPAGFWLNLVGALTGSIASALTGPLAVVAVAVLYYDLRTRNEGLDVELLVANLQAATPSAPSGPPSAVLPG